MISSQQKKRFSIWKGKKFVRELSNNRSCRGQKGCFFIEIYFKMGQEW